jgi:hypothetical protein
MVNYIVFIYKASRWFWEGKRREGVDALSIVL